MLVSVRTLARGRFVRSLQVPTTGCSPQTNVDDTKTVFSGDVGCQHFRQIHRTPGLQLLHPRRGNKPRGADRARVLLEKSEQKKKAKDAKVYEVCIFLDLILPSLSSMEKTFTHVQRCCTYSRWFFMADFDWPSLRMLNFSTHLSLKSCLNFSPWNMILSYK